MGDFIAVLDAGRGMEMPEYAKGVEERWGERGLWVFALVIVRFAQVDGVFVGIL